MMYFWQRSLDWFINYEPLPEHADRKDKYGHIVREIKAQLQDVTTVEELMKRYIGDNTWCLEIARRLYPNDWYLHSIHRLQDAAYAIRYLEIKEGR